MFEVSDLAALTQHRQKITHTGLAGQWTVTHEYHITEYCFQCQLI